MSYKSKLNEYCQKNALSMPVYRISGMRGNAHCPKFIMSCTVDDIVEDSGIEYPSSKKAQNAAARRIYSILTGIKEPERDSEFIHDKSNITVLIDGDNAPETVQWLLDNRPDWNLHFFITKNIPVKFPSCIRIHHSKSTLRDATDVAIIIYATRFLPIMTTKERLVIASRDKIFQTFKEELSSDSVIIAENIDRLAII